MNIVSYNLFWSAFCRWSTSGHIYVYRSLPSNWVLPLNTACMLGICSSSPPIYLFYLFVYPTGDYFLFIDFFSSAGVRGVLLMREFITAPGGTIAGTTARTASGTANWTQHISPTKLVPSIWKWRIHFWDLLTSASIAKQKKIWSKGESPERLTVQRRTAPWPMSGAFLKAQYIQLGLEYYELEDILLPEQLEEF